jgi:cytochrome c oxidase assembly protein Cox11
MNRTKRQLVGSRRQAGMTTMGLIILVIFVGLFAFAGIRLTPVFLNYTKVAGVVKGIEKEFDGQKASSAAIRKSVQRRFDIESVSEITWKDVKVAKVDGGFRVTAAYDHTTPFIANLSFTVHFNKTVMVRY